MNDFPLPPIIEQSSNKVLKKLASISHAQCDGAVKMFVRQSALRFKAGHWVNHEKPSKNYLACDVGDFKVLRDVNVTSLFTPFVEKHIFDPGTEIAVFGDIHGDIEALVLMLNQLCKDGYLNDDYRIIRDNFHLVFLGDYTNRKPFSIEVMMLIFHLHSNNIGKVFLLRGNNEYAVCNKNLYDRSMQAGRDASVEQETLLGELARKFEIYYYPDLLYWYDYLPLVTYLGCTDDQTGVSNFIQFCHAGLEIGFSPQPLFESPDARFQKIVRLNRQSALQKILQQAELAATHERIRMVFNYLKNTDLKSFAETYTHQGLIDFTHPHNPRVIKFGMQWNNYLTEKNDSIGIAASLKQRTLYFGSLITNYFLEQWQTPSSKIVSIMHGHQHLNDVDEAMGLNSCMLDGIIAGKGVHTQWGGKLYTLGDTGLTSGYQSFLMIKMQSNVKDWSVRHFSKKVNDARFTKTSRLFFDEIKVS